MAWEQCLNLSPWKRMYLGRCTTVRVVAKPCWPCAASCVVKVVWIFTPTGRAGLPFLLGDVLAVSTVPCDAPGAPWAGMAMAAASMATPAAEAAAFFIRGSSLEGGVAGNVPRGRGLEHDTTQLVTAAGETHINCGKGPRAGMPPPGIEPGTFGLRVRCSAS